MLNFHLSFGWLRWHHGPVSAVRFLCCKAFYLTLKGMISLLGQYLGIRIQWRTSIAVRRDDNPPLWSFEGLGMKVYMGPVSTFTAKLSKLHDEEPAVSDNQLGWNAPNTWLQLAV